jgi:hypothetical protein
MWSQVFARGFRMGSVKGQRVEFVIAQHGQSGIVLHHRSGNVDDIADLRSPVNEVTTKHGLSRFVAKVAPGF